MNAFAVVGDADEFHSAALNIDIDASGEGIDAVFEQFLDDAAGAFDDFTGGDAINDMRIELLNACHSGNTWGVCNEEDNQRDYNNPPDKTWSLEQLSKEKWMILFGETEALGGTGAEASLFWL